MSFGDVSHLLVGKRRSQVFWPCPVFDGLSKEWTFGSGRNGLLVVEWMNDQVVEFFVIYTFWGHLSESKTRILLGFIAGPKIQAHRHFLTNQIRIFISLFWSLNIFLWISFWAGFSRMFLFCVFSWLVEKYKNVTSMLMQFWSEISRIFFRMFLGLIILRLKNVYSIYSVAEPISMSTPQMNYVNENSQSDMKEQRRGNNNNKWQFICRIYKRVCKCPWWLMLVVEYS